MTELPEPLVPADRLAQALVRGLSSGLPSSRRKELILFIYERGLLTPVDVSTLLVRMNLGSA